MSQETIEDAIQRFRNDRQMIQQRQQERNDLFKKSSQNYLKTITHEIETIKKTEVVQEQRNKEFKDQINSLYLRYETGTERLKIAMKRTLIEKINYNNYLIKVYPNEYADQKRQLEDENDKLKRKIDEIKRANNAFDYRLQGALNRQDQGEMEDVKNKIDELREQVDEQYDPELHYQQHPEYQPYNYHGVQDVPEQGTGYTYHEPTLPSEPHPQIMPQAAIPINRPPLDNYSRIRPQSLSRDAYLPPASNKTDRLDQFLMQGQHKRGGSPQYQQ